MAENVFEFAKHTTLTIDAGNPGIISVRPSETLEVVRVTGKGRLLTSVSEASSNEPVVEGAVVFDSDAFQFLGGDPNDLSHTIIRDATMCALVELHVEQAESLEVVIRQTCVVCRCGPVLVAHAGWYTPLSTPAAAPRYRFGQEERSLNPYSSQ